MERREYVKWGRVAKGTAITFLGGFRTAVGIGEVGLGAASSSVGVGVLVAGHGVAQTGFGISDMGEGIHDIYLGFQDIDDEEQQAVRISKKVLGKYEEPLNFTVGATTNQVIVLGQAFYRFPRMSNMAGNTNSSTKKESNSNVTTEKERSNNSGTEGVVEDTTTNKTQPGKAQLHEGKQGKHVVGHNNYIEGRSEVNMETARNILNDFQNTGEKIERDEKIIKEIVDTQGKYIGIYINEKGERSVTSRFTIHYDSKGTAHIVPANPRP
ncbi:hypothetical protein FUSO6_05495 [Fusobacterium necrophorum DAB]|nr:polymorphic toxin type 50 domain-containing protein [Fusobacterium necrophorum]KDE69825.1 hypothetical protein FUSO6_05495 [Fusobacterium necrophorum DAB]